jgi:hypothetical protein
MTVVGREWKNHKGCFLARAEEEFDAVKCQLGQVKDLPNLAFVRGSKSSLYGGRRGWRTATVPVQMCPDAWNLCTRIRARYREHVHAFQGLASQRA